MPERTDSCVVTIATGASLSDASGKGNVVCAITDAAWDTNAMTFQGSVDGTNFFNLMDVDSGVEYSIASAVASSLYPLKAMNFFGLVKVKVRSGTSASAVNQNGATIVTLGLRAM